MSSKNVIPQQLKEIMDRGYSANGKYSIPAGSYILKDSTKIEKLSTQQVKNESTSFKVGFCFDGSFLPIRNGACYNVYNLMRSLDDTEKVDCNLMLCYRGWDDPTNYYNQKFNTIFIDPVDYYEHNGNIENYFKAQGITFAQFYSSEGVLNLAKRLKAIGIKTIFEVQNIDYVLYERLGSDREEVERIKQLQVDALRLSDFVLCRSEIDKNLAIELGADPDCISTYRGGIYVQDFTFKARKTPRYNLVFLGHLFYPPNENAVKLMVEQILPQLDERYKLTIIGIGPGELINKYASERIIFKKGIDDISSELLNYDIALAPLLQGSGTRLKILDYLASGIPTISSNIGTEGLDPRIKSHIVVEDDIDAYSKHIMEIMSNLPRYEERMLSGRKFVEELYDWKNCLDPFLSTYQRLSKVS